MQEAPTPPAREPDDEPASSPWFERVAAASSIGVAVFDEELRYLTVNDALAKLDGLPKGAHVGRALTDLFPRARDEIEALLRRVIETGEPVVGREERAPIEGPHAPHLLVSWFRVELSPGRFGLMSTIEDVTGRMGDRLRAEREREELLLQEHRARLAAEHAVGRIAQLQGLTSALSGALDLAGVARAILDHTSVALGADATGVFVLDDDGAELLLLAHRGLPESIVPLLRSVPSSGPSPIAMTARTGRAEWLDALDGHELRMPLALPAGLRSGAAIPLRIDGKHIGTLAFGYRAPRVFPAEERGFMLMLAEQCALALDRARLHEAEQDARHAAEIASRTKDEFLTVLSHELRTPLTAILGWSNILRTRAADRRTLERALETIERNAKAQARLIEDILDMSRIVTGKLRLNARLVDPAAVVRSALDVVRPSTEAKGIAIDEAIAADVSMIRGDPDRLQQIAWNLLSNAVKFTPRGGHIGVSLERLGSQVRLGVSDTGQGIAAEFLPHVFERFTQADASLTRAHGGLGLGLAIVKHLVDLHGGAITASSAGTGLGATFTVTLPIPAVMEAHGARRTDPARASSAARLDGVRVLVVDDEPDARELIAAILEDQGAHVTLASSAAEALLAIEAADVDVMVSDIGMPGEDGYSLLLRARALLAERERYLPALALTAYAGAQDAKAAYRTGFQMHLAKPVAPSQLVDAIARLAGAA